MTSKQHCSKLDYKNTVDRRNKENNMSIRQQSPRRAFQNAHQDNSELGIYLLSYNPLPLQTPNSRHINQSGLQNV